MHTEKGFFRPGDGTGIEAVISHITGITEIWTGINEVLSIEDAKITSARARLATNLVGRTPSAKPVDAGDRLYGLMNGELMWTYDMAAVGQEMQNHLWARLKPLSDSEIIETKNGPLQIVGIPWPTRQNLPDNYDCTQGISSAISSFTKEHIKELYSKVYILYYFMFNFHFLWKVIILSFINYLIFQIFYPLFL